MEMDDDEILMRAAEILTQRKRASEEIRAAEVKRLFKRYAQHRAQEDHHLGKPKKLLPLEALLLVALERNKYVVCIEKGESRWHGDAECKFHLRGTAMALSADSRLDLLWALWASVSDQVIDDGHGSVTIIPTVLLEEEHFRGSIVQRDIRALNREVRAQNKAEDRLQAAGD